MSGLIKVLSIDGGGIRGIIPALILAAIEERTQKRIAELFDLIAGTSTGGILALGLTKPGIDNKTPEYAARDLVNFYEKEGQKIFPSSVFNQVRSLFDEKYPATGIESVLAKYFGETRLSDVLKDVLIPSYEIELRQPYFFKSTKAKNPQKRNKCNFKMKDVARATSAAPTYFEPLHLETPDKLDSYAFIDGGVFANNPAMCAYVEAKTLFPEATDFLVVSIGTGELAASLSYKDVKDWGLLQWAQPILNVTFDGISDTVDYQLQQLLSSEDKPQRYFRFQTPLFALGERGDHIDDASEEHIRHLKRLAKIIIDKNDKDLNRLCNVLDNSRLTVPQADMLHTA